MIFSRKKNLFKKLIYSSVAGALALSLILLLLYPSEVAWGQLSDPLYPKTAANDSSIGTVAWSNPSRVTSDDNSEADASLNCNSSNYLKATNFGFFIPPSSTVSGIQVEWKKRGSVASAILDNAVRIVKGGTIGSQDKSSGTNWPTTAATTTYGGQTDLWGETWTVADINSTSFGAALSAKETPCAGASAFLDAVRITVYYTESPAPYHLRIESFSSNGTSTIPSGVTSATFEAWAGGGGGAGNAGCTEESCDPAGGGGGGAYMKTVKSVSAGQAFDIYVGAGGAGGAGGGSDGGTSTVADGVTNILEAAPGWGGDRVGGTGGEGGKVASSTGDFGFDGGNGPQVAGGNNDGGSGAGDAGNGTAGDLGGGDSFGGSSNTTANNRLYGSGGGNTSLSRAGKAGIVRVSYFLDVGVGYPVIKSRSRGSSRGDATSHTINLPSGVLSGDLLMVVFSVDAQPDITISGSGWSMLAEDDRIGLAKGGVYYKVADGNDALTLSTSASEDSTHLSFRIANAGTPTAASTTGTSATINPPSLDTGSVAKYLWIAAAAIDQGVVVGGVTDFPTNYTDFLYLSSPFIASGAGVTAATRHLEAQTEDPGAFTNYSEDWVAFTIAVPFSGANPGVPVTNANAAKTTIRGGVTIKGGVTFKFFLPIIDTILSSFNFSLILPLRQIRR